MGHYNSEIGSVVESANEGLKQASELAKKLKNETQPSLWGNIQASSKIKYEITETVQQISIIFAVVFCLCLLYLSHFWLLRGDNLIKFLAALSLVNFLSFYGYVKIKDRLS